MLEFAILYRLCGRIGGAAREKGRRAVGYQLMLVLFWFGGEVGVAFLACLAIAIFTGEDPDGYLLPLCAAGLAGGAAAAWVAFRIVKDLPDRTEDPWAERAERAADELLGHPQAGPDEALALLEGRGLTPPEAWRAYQFLPIAFAHAVLGADGVEFPPGYVLVDPDTGERTAHLLADEPLYVAGVAAAERRLAEGWTRHQLLPVFGRSAEFEAVRRLGGSGNVRLAEPLLTRFGG